MTQTLSNNVEIIAWTVVFMMDDALEVARFDPTDEGEAEAHAFEAEVIEAGIADEGIVITSPVVNLAFDEHGDANLVSTIESTEVATIAYERAGTVAYDGPDAFEDFILAFEADEETPLTDGIRRPNRYAATLAA